LAQDAIGMIETKGLIAAIEAADVMLKSANVEILGSKYHKVRSGIIAVIVTGDVGAVQSAVEAGSDAAKRIGEVLAVDVIARTDKSVLKMLIPQVNKKEKEIKAEEKQEKIDKKKSKEEKQEKVDKKEAEEENQERIRKEDSKQESKVEGKQEKTNIENNKIENKKEVKDTSKSKDKGKPENSDKSSNSKNAKK
jgi:microcompartment protein CcmL/EutN